MNKLRGHPGEDFIASMGWDYTNTESAARRVAEEAEKRIIRRDNIINGLQEQLRNAVFQLEHDQEPINPINKPSVDIKRWAKVLHGFGKGVRDSAGGAGDASECARERTAAIVFFSTATFMKEMASLLDHLEY